MADCGSDSELRLLTVMLFDSVKVNGRSQGERREVFWVQQAARVGVCDRTEDEATERGGAAPLGHLRAPPRGKGPLYRFFHSLPGQRPSSPQGRTPPSSAHGLISLLGPVGRHFSGGQFTLRE